MRGERANTFHWRSIKLTQWTIRALPISVARTHVVRTALAVSGTSIGAFCVRHAQQGDSQCQDDGTLGVLHSSTRPHTRKMAASSAPKTFSSFFQILLIFVWKKKHSSGCVKKKTRSQSQANIISQCFPIVSGGTLEKVANKRDRGPIVTITLSFSIVLDPKSSKTQLPYFN